MKQLDIQQVAIDLQYAVQHYIQEVFMDRTRGFLQKEFEEELAVRGGSDCIEVSTRVPDFSIITRKPDDKRPSDWFDILYGGKTVTMTRVMTPEYTFDLSMLRVNPMQFLDMLKTGIREYASKLPVGTTHVSLPALYINVRGFTVEWMLWGMCGAYAPADKTLTSAQGQEVAE